MARSLFGARGGAPFTTAGWRKMVARLGVAAKLSFKAHPHMFRHACGFGLPTRAPTPAPCKRISAIATSSTPCATPSCRPRASRTSGAPDADCPMARLTPTARYHAASSPSSSVSSLMQATRGRRTAAAIARLAPGSWRSSSAMNCIGHPSQTVLPTPALPLANNAKQLCQVFYFLWANLPASFHHEVFGLRARRDGLNSRYKSSNRPLFIIRSTRPILLRCRLTCVPLSIGASLALDPSLTESESRGRLPLGIGY